MDQGLPRCGDLPLPGPGMPPPGYAGTAVEWNCQDADAWLAFLAAQPAARGKVSHHTKIQEAGISATYGQLLAPVRH